MPNRQRGFGLVELLIALAMLGVLAAVAMPRLWTLSDEWRLKQEAMKFAAFLECYRELSVARPDGSKAFRQASLQPSPMLERSETGYAVRLSGNSDEYLVPKYTLPVDITLSTNSDSPVFSQYGAAGGTNMHFTLKCHEATQYVIIDVEGRIRVSDSPP